MRVFDYQMPEIENPTQMVLLFETNGCVWATDICCVKTSMEDPYYSIPVLAYSREDWERWYKEVIDVTP